MGLQKSPSNNRILMQSIHILLLQLGKYTAFLTVSVELKKFSKRTNIQMK